MKWFKWLFDSLAVRTVLLVVAGMPPSASGDASLP